ncbi:hypothetical protein WKS98_09590, partial [Lagierella sp. ICN-221743]
ASKKVLPYHCDFPSYPIPETQPFTPLKRLGIPQTPMEDEENLVGFSFCAFRHNILRINLFTLICAKKKTRLCHVERATASRNISLFFIRHETI